MCGWLCDVWFFGIEFGVFVVLFVLFCVIFVFLLFMFIMGGVLLFF